MSCAFEAYEAAWRCHQGRPYDFDGRLASYFRHCETYRRWFQRLQELAGLWMGSTSGGQADQTMTNFDFNNGYGQEALAGNPLRVSVTAVI